MHAGAYACICMNNMHACIHNMHACMHNMHACIMPKGTDGHCWQHFWSGSTRHNRLGRRSSDQGCRKPLGVDLRKTRLARGELRTRMPPGARTALQHRRRPGTVPENSCGREIEPFSRYHSYRRRAWLRAAALRRPCQQSSAPLQRPVGSPLRLAQRQFHCQVKQRDPSSPSSVLVRLRHARAATREQPAKEGARWTETATVSGAFAPECLSRFRSWYLAGQKFTTAMHA